VSLFIFKLVIKKYYLTILVDIFVIGWDVKVSLLLAELAKLLLDDRKGLSHVLCLLADRCQNNFANYSVGNNLPFSILTKHSFFQIING